MTLTMRADQKEPMRVDSARRDVDGINGCGAATENPKVTAAASASQVMATAPASQVTATAPASSDSSITVITWGSDTQGVGATTSRNEPS